MDYSKKIKLPPNNSDKKNQIYEATEIVRVLHNHGYSAVFAGGYPRDLLLNVPSDDIDIATNATPDQIKELFSDSICVGESFGVIKVIGKYDQYDVATFRKDSSEYSDGRHPVSVSFSTMEEDAKRRDLTINGIFFDPLTEQFFDFVQGIQDIRDGIIRLIGDPQKRIEEDKLRLMRVVRFTTRFGFKIEDETYQAVFFHASEISSVSAERVADEMTKILKLQDKRKALQLLLEFTLLQIILPEIAVMVGCEQPPQFHPEGDVFEHTIQALEYLPQDASEVLLWATLLHDVGKPSTQTFEDRIRFSGHDKKGMYLTREILQRLKFSNDFIDRVASLVENHMKFTAVEVMKKATLKRFIGLPHFDEHLELHKVDCLSSHGDLEHYKFVLEKMKTFESSQEEVTVNKLPRIITGNDLIALGYSKGPIFRTILTDVEDQQLEGEITNKIQALEYLKVKYPL